MSFTSLPLELQNIYLQEYSMLSKFVLFGVLMFLACLYLFYLFPKQKKTAFFTVVIFRLFFYACSIVYLVGSPLLWIQLAPDYSFWDMYNFFIVIYGVGLSIFFIIALIDFLRFGLLGLLKFGGLDLGDEGIRDVVEELSKNRHGLK